jgi:hypothetical protein
VLAATLPAPSAQGVAYGTLVGLGSGLPLSLPCSLSLGLQSVVGHSRRAVLLSVQHWLCEAWSSTSRSTLIHRVCRPASCISKGINTGTGFAGPSPDLPCVPKTAIAQVLHSAASEAAVRSPLSPTRKAKGLGHRVEPQYLRARRHARARSCEPGQPQRLRLAGWLAYI